MQIKELSERTTVSARLLRTEHQDDQGCAALYPASIRFAGELRASWVWKCKAIEVAVSPSIWTLPMPSMCCHALKLTSRPPRIRRA